MILTPQCTIFAEAIVYSIINLVLLLFSACNKQCFKRFTILGCLAITIFKLVFLKEIWEVASSHNNRSNTEKEKSIFLFSMIIILPFIQNMHTRWSHTHKEDKGRRQKKKQDISWHCAKRGVGSCFKTKFLLH